MESSYPWTKMKSWYYQAKILSNKQLGAKIAETYFARKKDTEDGWSDDETESMPVCLLQDTFSK